MCASFSKATKLSYLSLALSLGQVDLFQHLRPLFHHQGLLVSVGWDVAVVLRQKKRTVDFFPLQLYPLFLCFSRLFTNVFTTKTPHECLCPCWLCSSTLQAAYWCLNTLYVFHAVHLFFLFLPKSATEIEVVTDIQAHHFYNFHHGINTEVIEECGQVLLHLDAVVVHLGHGEDAHLALPPNLSSKYRQYYERVMEYDIDCVWSLFHEVCILLGGI